MSTAQPREKRSGSGTAGSALRACIAVSDRAAKPFSAYVYPERVNGEKGAYFDAFANEQDGLLYLAYKTEEL